MLIRHAFVIERVMSKSPIKYNFFCDLCLPSYRAPIGSFHVGFSNEKSPEANRGLTSRRRQAVSGLKIQHVLIFLALSALCINGYIEVNIHLEISVAASLIGLVIYRR